MGQWSHPKHYSATAQQLEVRTRQAQIAVFKEVVLPRLRETARTAGYALAVHGSEARDLDLLAAPWKDDAVDAATLLRALAATTRDCTGWGFLEEAEKWEAKPHGRVAATILGTSDVHLDISVMPCIASAKASADA
jgi:hypothetical protein